jgi:hypothetical protein
METLNEKQAHKKSHEHSARLKNPGKYESFATGEDKGGKGINFIYGIRKKAGPGGGKSEIQAIRFDSKLWSAADARKWLSDHDKKYIKFTAATVNEDGAPAVAPAAPAAPAASSGPAITTSNMGAKYAPKVFPMTSHLGDYTVDRFDQSFMRKMKKHLGEAFSPEEIENDDERLQGYKIFEMLDGTFNVEQDGEVVANFDTKKQAGQFVNSRLGERIYREADEPPVNAPKSEPAIAPDGTPTDVDAKGKDLIVPRDTDPALFDDYVKIYNSLKPEERATDEKLAELAISIIKKYFGDKETQWGSDGIEVMDDQLIFKNFSSSEDAVTEGVFHKAMSMLDKAQPIPEAVSEKKPCRFCGRTFDVSKDERGYACAVCNAKLGRGASLTVKYPESVIDSGKKTMKEATDAVSVFKELKHSKMYNDQQAAEAALDLVSMGLFSSVSGEKRKQMIANLIKKATVKNESEDEPEIDEPSDDDCFMSPSGSLGSKTSVSCGGKFIGEFDDEDDAVIAIGDWQEKHKWWPAVWIVSDHGNNHLYSDFADDYKKAKRNKN